MGDTVEHCNSGLTGTAIEIEKRWFAVFTVPRHEKRVEQHFCVRGIESFLPLYQAPRHWKDGSKGILKIPLFSCYIFVRIGCGERVPVLEVPGVILIVGSARQPFSIADSYILSLREAVGQGKIEPHPYLTAGTRVRIRSGIMTGAEGILLRKKNSFRVVLTLEMIMKSMTVEVNIDDVEPVSHASSCSHVPQIAAKGLQAHGSDHIGP